MPQRRLSVGAASPPDSDLWRARASLRPESELRGAAHWPPLSAGPLTTPRTPGPVSAFSRTLLLLPRAGKGRKAEGRRSAGRGLRERGMKVRILEPSPTASAARRAFPVFFGRPCFPRRSSGLTFRPLSPSGVEVLRGHKAEAWAVPMSSLEPGIPRALY